MLIRLVAVVVAAAALFFVGILAASELGGEVVSLYTVEPDGREHTTRGFATAPRSFLESASGPTS